MLVVRHKRCAYFPCSSVISHSDGGAQKAYQSLVFGFIASEPSIRYGCTKRCHRWSSQRKASKRMGAGTCSCGSIDHHHFRTGGKFVSSIRDGLPALRAPHSTIFLLQTEKIMVECRVRYLSFLGIGKDAKHCAFIMHTAQDQFVCHVFHCEPSSGTLCKTIEAACKVIINENYSTVFLSDIEDLESSTN